MERFMRKNDVTKNLTNDHLYDVTYSENKIRKVCFRNGNIRIVLNDGSEKNINTIENTFDWSIHKAITQLEVDGDIDVNLCKNVATMPYIKYASINSKNITYNFLSKLPALESLELSVIPSGNPESVDWDKLTKFKIDRISENTNILSAMTSLEKITVGKVELGACLDDGKWDVQLPESLKRLQIAELAANNLDFIRNLQLEELTICNSALENMDALENQADMLELLSLGDYMTDDLDVIGNLKNLRYLEIGEYMPEGMSFLEKLENLEVLSIKKGDVDDEFFNKLDRMPNLKAVYVPTLVSGKPEEKHKYTIIEIIRKKNTNGRKIPGYEKLCDEWKEEAEMDIILPED